MRGAAILPVIAIATALFATARAQSPPSPNDIAQLHRAVFERPMSQSLPDPEKSETLARLYAEGTGVRRDPVMACTLFDFSARARMDRPGGLEGLALMEAAQQRKSQYCDGLNATERHWAYVNLGCAIFGLSRETVLELGPGWWVKFPGPSVVLVEFAGKEHEHGIGSVGFFCPASQVVLTRHSVVEGPPTAPSRHLIELATWRPGCCEHTGTRVFTWRAYEVKGGDLREVAVEQLTEPGSIFPVPSPSFSSGASFRALESGDIEYQLTLDTVRRGRLAAR